MMNIKEIKQLLNLVSEHDLAEFELEREGDKISIKKYSPPSMATTVIPTTSMTAPVANTPAASVKESEKTMQSDNLHVIKSPIVGTYYSAPSPDSDPFISVGSKIGENDTVCIIEAMKVMNEIKAEVSGTIEEILVENGQVVEFGQVLFKVKK